LLCEKLLHAFLPVIQKNSIKSCANFSELTGWHTRASKLRQMLHLSKEPYMNVLFLKKKWCRLLQGKKIFMYFGNDLRKKRSIMKKTFILITTVLASVLYANKGFSQSSELVNVYSWYNTEDKNFVTVVEGEYQDGQLLNWNWKDKKLMFVAYRNPGADRVAVYSWFNPVTKDQVSIAEDEYTDDQMLKMGYTGKKLQFYALTRRGPNTLAIYRWCKGTDWVTVPEEGNTDAYIKKSYKHKTYQYFGIARSVDAIVYDQL